MERIPDALRAEVSAALLAGIGLSETARRYSLPKSTVQRIKERLGDAVEQAGQSHRESIDALLAKSLEAHVAATYAIARQAQDEEYLRSQTGRDVAALHESLAAHAVRLLEAAALSEPCDADG